MLNIASIKGYGLGDVIIPFAKTPANLTASPATVISISLSGFFKIKSLTIPPIKNIFNPKLSAAVDAILTAVLYSSFSCFLTSVSKNKALTPFDMLI